MNAGGLGMLLTFLGTSGLSPVLSVSSSASMDSIEGMTGQRFSVGVFIFMLIGVFVFTSIVYVATFGGNKHKKLKRGEKVMVVAIMLGVVLACIMGGVQLLGGDLF